MLETSIRWISVRDEYPDADMVVLVACIDEDSPVWFGFTDGSEWFDCSTGNNFVGPVTHWAELPMSPNPPDASAERAWEAEQERLAERGYP